MLIRLFSSAGAAGHVFFLSNGRTSDKGLAYSGIIGPMTTVAVVPTTSQILHFSIEAKTKDKQAVTINGSVTVTLNPQKAVSKFDFTVDPKTGGYKSRWEQVLQSKVVERVLRAVLNKVKDLDVENATRSQEEVEDAVTATLADESLRDDGITINSCSIPEIVPSDDDVSKAIGATERQTILTTADLAGHQRRLKASENDRKIKQYEADTKFELEKKEGVLLEERTKNEKTKADSDAETTKIRLAPLQEVESGKLLGVALMEAAKGGKLGSISLTTELMSLVSKNGN